MKHHKYLIFALFVCVVTLLSAPALAQQESQPVIDEEAVFYGTETYFTVAVNHEHFDYMGMHIEGEAVALDAAFDEQGNLKGLDRIAWVRAEGDSVILEVNEDGLPAQIFYEESGTTLLFFNYTEETVDLAEITSEGGYTVFEGLPLDSTLLDELATVYQQLGAPRQYVSAAFSDHMAGVEFDKVVKAWKVAGLFNSLIENVIFAADGLKCAAHPAGCVSLVLTTLKIVDMAAVDDPVVHLIIDSASALVGWGFCAAGNPLSCVGAVMDTVMIAVDIAEIAFEEAEKTKENNSTYAVCGDSAPPRLREGGYGRKSPGGASNMRATPGGAIIGVLSGGERFAVIDGPVCSGGYNWWQIQTSGGNEGWIAEAQGSAYFVETISAAEYEAPAPPPASGGSRVTLSSSPTVPIYPDSLFNCGAASPIAEVPNGIGATILEGPVNACGGNDWYKVQVDNGVVGWVSSGRVVR